MGLRVEANSGDELEVKAKILKLAFDLEMFAAGRQERLDMKPLYKFLKIKENAPKRKSPKPKTDTI